MPKYHMHNLESYEYINVTYMHITVYCTLLFIRGEKVSRFFQITWQPRNFFGEFL